MNKLLGALLLLTLTACASVEYQPYEGKPNEVWEGQGGTKLVVDGVDFWDNGSPPRRFKVVGYAKGAIGEGYGADPIIRSSVASKVRAMNGNAAILVNGNTTAGGFIKTAPNVWLAAGTRELKYAVVKYLN